MALLLLRIKGMRGLHRLKAIGLFIFICVGTAAHAAILEIAPDLSPTVPDNESFPLLETPLDAPPPPRSQAPTAAEEAAWRDTKKKILSDFASRMTPEFLLPAGLDERVSFWFDIYTRYGEAHHIVHHERFPWIIYRVVDTTDILLSGRGPLWLRRGRASKLAKAQAHEIRVALARLAKRTSYERLPSLERDLFEKLKAVPGSRRAVLRLAASSVRSQLGQRDFFERGLINSSRYLPYMEEEFRSFGLPTELTRLPFVESSFNEDARSKVGASGIWQIMPQTGKAYLRVDAQVDERNSPLKATRAAARLLRSYYRALGSWPLALTSYNNGIGNIQKAIKGANSRDLATIIARYHRGDFKFASSNFFTCFIAALYAEKYNELIFKSVPRLPLQEREIVALPSKTRPRELTRAVGLSKDELLKYNLDLRAAFKSNATLPRGYQLHLPPGLKSKLERQIGTQDKRGRPRT